MKSLTACIILATVALPVFVAESCGQTPPAKETGLGAFISQQVDKAAAAGGWAQPAMFTPLRRYREGRECQVVVLKTERGYRLWVLENDPHDQGIVPALEVQIYGELEPGRPEYFDADGDGCEEIFITLENRAAGRGATTFVLLSHRGGSWKAFCAPTAAGVIRDQVGDVKVYAETIVEAIEFDGGRHDVEVLCRGGWRGFERKNQRLFLVYTAVAEGEAPGATHRYAAILYRFTGDGFEQVADWNKNRVFVTKEPVCSSPSDIVGDWFYSGFHRKGFLIYDVNECLPATALVGQDDTGGQTGDSVPCKEVPLPSSVQSAIYDVTIAAFESEHYEGSTLLSDLFGPVHRFGRPDDAGLHVYAYCLHRMPIFRSCSIVILAHDTKADRVTAKPVCLPVANAQDYCPRPWIRFTDICGDFGSEIVAFSGHHSGTWVNDITMYGFSIEEDLALTKRLEIQTGQMKYDAFAGDTWPERYGYIVRTVEKQTPERLAVTVSLSRDKLAAGDQVLGFEVYEIGQTGQYERTEAVVCDERFRSPFKSKE